MTLSSLQTQARRVILSGFSPSHCTERTERKAACQTCQFKGLFEWFEHPSLQIEVSQIIIHKAHQPNVVVGLFDAHGLAGEDRAEKELRS